MCTMKRKACTEGAESVHSMTVQYALIHRYLRTDYFGLQIFCCQNVAEAIVAYLTPHYK